MGKIIAISNQKGGTGKTTTTVNLGTGLANEGKKVLLIDYDAQGSLTQCLGYPNPDELSVTISSLMEKSINERPTEHGEGILHHSEGVDFIPANIELSGMETFLVNTMSRERVLKNYLSQIKDNYDYVLIDCTPSLGMLTINALTAANEVIIPVQSHFLPTKGLEQLLGTVAKVKRQLNPTLKINGILLTMVDGRTNLAKDMLADLYITRKTFSAQELTYSPAERFISNDEIDKLLQRGGIVSNGKYRIYTFFDTHNDKKERIKFLKNEYGIGGSYNGVSNEDHGGKGISFSHGDLTKPYAKILLKWNEVEKRIDRLIKSRNYLNEAEIKNIPNYEKEQVAHSIRRAYAYDITEGMVKPYPSGSEYTDATKILVDKLSDTTHTQTLY